MILVTGSILAKPDALDEVLALSLEHVRRSRAEPGCISHAVHHDAENPLRLVFVEQWADRAALMAHFAVPASRAFAKAAGELASEPPTIQIYDAQAVQTTLSG
jgi:quinol monooxygenase YgiN